jgi:hypothetical protein
MTALTKYQRLESPGLWRETPEAQRREVIVAFREATLVLSDPKTETALTHWSLPAVERLNSGELPAIYAPGKDADETLEMDDSVMIAALETIRSALARSTPKPGRLRGTLLGGGLFLLLAGAIFWLPDALVTHAVSVLTPSARAQIGQAALADVVRLTGAPCSTPLGARALDMLSTRLFGALAPDMLVLREGLTQTVQVPGQMVLIGRYVIDAAKTPEAAAGAILAASVQAQAEDPLLPILRHAGLVATMRLLATGSLPDGALAGYGEALLRREAPPIANDALLMAFQAAKVSSAAYGYALDPTGESTLGLIEADPYRAGSPSPLLSPEDWKSLREICD